MTQQMTSRRTLVKGAAWAAPAVAVATSAPAVAASGSTGTIAAGPWHETWPIYAQNVNGDEGGVVPYIIMPTTDTSGAAAYDQNSAQATTWDQDGDGAYPCDTTSGGTYGAGETITITIRENLGTYYGTTPVTTSQTAPGPAAWPYIDIADAGVYQIEGYEGPRSSGGLIFGAWNESTRTWTWTLTMLQNARPCGSDPLTWDFWFKSQGLTEDGQQRLSQYTITVTSPWGTVTQEIPAQG